MRTDGARTRLPHGCALAAVVNAEAPIVLGLTAGVLALDDVAGFVATEGDEAAMRTFFEAPANPTP